MTLRIVHCFRSPVGGIFRHVRDLSEAQAAAGHQVGIICDSSTGGDFEARLFAGMGGILALGVHRTPMQRQVGPGDIAAAWRTFRLIRRLRPDVLHGHGAKGGVYARLFGSVLRASRSRVARAYSPHGGSLHYDAASAKGKLFFAAERLMGRVTDRLFFVSAYEERAYREKVGGPQAPTSLVYNGLRPDEFEPVPPSPDAADFLYIGMMRDLKGPDLFIDALARAEAITGRRVSAAMVGAGDQLPDYLAQVKRLGLAESVTFHQPMPARAAFTMARMIVVPSRAEAMPYIVLEALAAGMPMIASRVGGIPEILGEGSPALTEPSRADIARQMSLFLEDETGYRAIMPSSDSLRARFGSDVMARAITEAYAQVLAGRRSQ